MGLVGKIFDVALEHPGAFIGAAAGAGLLAETHMLGLASHGFQSAAFGDPYAFRRMGTGAIGGNYNSPSERTYGTPLDIGAVGMRPTGSLTGQSRAVVGPSTKGSYGGPGDLAGRPMDIQNDQGETTGTVWPRAYPKRAYGGPDGSIVFGMYNTRM